MTNQEKEIREVGTANNTNIYVMPEPSNEEYVKEAILTRFQGVERDLASIYQIAKKANISLDWNDFDVDIYKAKRSGKSYLCHVLIALDCMGIIENSDSLYTEIARSDLYQEMKYLLQNHLVDSRRKALALLVKSEKRYEESIEEGVDCWDKGHSGEYIMKDGMWMDNLNEDSDELNIEE